MNVRLSAASAMEAALKALEAERAVINDLNVYPVPDGDTGTNLALTVRAVLEELEQSSAESIPDVAATVTKGSLMGARGNSGVILSQIVRGACDVWGRSLELSTADFKLALIEASSCAYRAVKVPVEGTMLTVIREMAAAAQGVPDDFGLDGLLMVVEEAGRVAVEKTTAQLPVLQKAGVVDAGGYGLLVLFRGFAAGIGELMDDGARLSPADVALYSSTTSRAPRAPAPGHSELSEFRYCTSLLISGSGIDVASLESFLPSIGDSDLVVGDERMVKVHLHTNDPGALLSAAVRLGALSEVEINDMHAQTAERDERLQRRLGEVAGASVVAVAAGEGNKQLFRDLGCHGVVDGGQSMNPSAAQLLEAIEEMPGQEVVILPNNANIVLAAEQAAGMSSRHVAVVPSSSMPIGLAAMIAFDPEADAVTNGRMMEEAIEGMHWAEVTLAVRACELEGINVNAGQALGLVDGRLVSAGDELETAVRGVLDEFARGGADYVTVLTALNGSTMTRERLEELAAHALPEAEIHFHEGGQPLYPILASAE